jgi:hypothetical protein
MVYLLNNFYVIFRVIMVKIELLFFLIDMLLDTAIYTASIFPEAWYGMTLIHREFAEYAYSRVGILKYRELFTKVEIEIEEDDKYTNIFGKLNSIEDKPAIIRANGTKSWYINGKRHRDNDKPAIIEANGDKVWYINGNCHRNNDKPAFIGANGDKEWFINGKWHRSRDAFNLLAKPAVIDANGNKWLYINNTLTIVS